MNILISGASIAGPALAYWLRAHGFRPTVVERSPAIRTGGQAIDIRGTALEVVDRMGLLPEIRAAATDMIGMSYVDSDGAELMRSTERTLTGGDLDSPDVELMRTDLTRILHQATPDTEYVFGDSISALVEDEHCVRVTFASGRTAEFDLVIGADGVHSTVRSLVFGPEAEFAHHLGSYIAVFTVPNFLELDRWQVFHQAPGRLAGVFSARGNTEVRAMLGFESPALEFDHCDTEAQKRAVAEHFGGDGWAVPRLLKEMWEAPDFYFDAMSQIRMPTWSRGRVALVGDAGYCASLLSGMGTSLALVGAYLLAGELSGGDHSTAFARYEEQMREYVRLCQNLAETNRDNPGQGLEEAAGALRLRDYL